MASKSRTSWARQSWFLGAVNGLCILIILPMLSLALTAMGNGEGLIFHLMDTVLLRYLKNTVVLMLGVGVLTLLFGITTAWIISRYEFPGRRLIGWMLLLPAAIPSYIIAYVYTSFFEYAGLICVTHQFQHHVSFLLQMSKHVK